MSTILFDEDAVTGHVLVFDTPETNRTTHELERSYLTFDATEAPQALTTVESDFLLFDVLTPVEPVEVESDFLLVDEQAPTEIQYDIGEGDLLVITSGGVVGRDGADGLDGVGVPTGGRVGQVLAKTSGADYATAWVDAPTGGTGSGDEYAYGGTARDALEIHGGTPMRG